MSATRIASNVIPSDKPGKPDTDTANEEILRRVRAWLEHAVIGLRLCPFAAPVHRSGNLGVRIAPMQDEVSLLVVLERELALLSHGASDHFESVLLVMPNALQDFSAFNAFLGRVDETLAMTGLEGDIQVASFHPDYQFAGEDPDDPSNCTNRAPYPVLHLLLESSVTRAVASVADPQAIPERNQALLRQLGHSGWTELSRHWAPATPSAGVPPRPCSTGELPGRRD